MDKMLSFNFESGFPDFSASSDGELLRDIEEISKSLYVESKTPENSLISFSSFGPKSSKKSHCDKSNKCLKEEQNHSSIWGWKPFKVLSHMRRKKFNCYFFCHVHCIENLMLDLNDISMNVIWKRKDNVLRTLPSRVSNGMVEFEETLMSNCTVYGTRNGPGDFVKYEPKHFLLYASIVGAEGIEFGKHWVDLTRILPVTLEELEQDKCSGKWSTSFKLMGNAKGATLHVSFGFLVTKDGLAESNSCLKPPLVLSLEQNGMSRMSFTDSNSLKVNSTLRRVGSVPSSLTDASCYSSRCLDAKIDLPKDTYDFSNSINMLYGKLEQGNADSPTKFGMVSKNLEAPQLVVNSLNGFIPDTSRAKHDDDAEFAVLEKGVESDCSSKEARMLGESLVEDLKLSSIEIVDVGDIFKDEELCSDEEVKIDRINEAFDSVAIDTPIDKYSVVDTKESTLKEEVLDLNEMFISETDKLELLEDESSVDNKVKHKGSHMVKSLSLDDFSKSVVDDFCKMLQDLRTPSLRNHNVDLESPREILLRQFEEEMMTSGNLFLGGDVENGIPDYDFAASKGSSSDYHDESMEFPNESVPESSKSKLKARSLERLETQTLMEKWGLNEEAFQNSPYYNTGGFGSPIFVPPDEPVGMPPIAEGLGPLLPLKNGGCLRSMNPLLFRNTKSSEGLIIQTSKTLVLPMELGPDVMEILQCLASVGSERLSKKVHSLMPLEDLSGKIMQQLAWEASDEAEVLKRPAYSQHEYDIKIEIEQHPYVHCHTSSSSSSAACNNSSKYVSAKDLAFLAIDTMEDLVMEGLKIQSGTPEHDPPSSISVKGTAYDVNELLDLSISLDDWLRDQENTEYESRKCGFSRDDLTLGLMMQLRDPLRNYEPVGEPMLGLVQVKRLIKSVTQTLEAIKEGEDMISRFRLDEVHVAGLSIASDKLESWSSRRQQQSGSRWLLASGLTKNRKSRFSKSRSIMKLPALVLKKPWARSCIWSISHPIHEVEVDPENPLIRNPDILFPQVTV
ncbi:Protein PLASTID MOVEMENT IMPAIRED 1-RELATED 2 [Bienertia sinuspersici]